MTRTLGEDVKDEDLKDEDLAFKRFFNIRYLPRSISRGINAQQPKPPRGGPIKRSFPAWSARGGPAMAFGEPQCLLSSQAIETRAGLLSGTRQKITSIGEGINHEALVHR
jgi:hypothetical protein